MTEERDPGAEEKDGTREAAAENPPAEDIARELGETKRKLAYLAAELENFKKRSHREHEKLVAFGNEKLLKALLPVIDNLERAIAQGASSGASGALIEGVRMTCALFLAELRKFGVEQMEAAGKPFDPSVHEAVAHLPAPGVEEGTVLEEACKGYTLHGRLLRAAQVAVARGADAAPPGDGEGR
jgi:molecular chaperone GrpE